VAYTVGKVAELAGVTVRTLHHYDEIGLLSPSERSATGYRRYVEADLERLQQILYYRELEFSLEEIAAILDDPQSDETAHLRRQHELLTGRIKRMQEMVTAIEFAMEAKKVGINLTPEERFEVFGDFNPDDHTEEVEQRWGGTDAYKESSRRTARYTKDDWLRNKQENEDWGRRFTELMDSGATAESPEAMELAEEHRQLISRWFYECGYEIHRGLTEMYVSDERFRSNYDTQTPGLAAFIRDAARANAGRAETGR
jgi:MerR family transcriptional regulator, thiopeptide resistance regulator